LRLFVAIGRTSKFAFVKLEESANIHTAAAFLKAIVEAVPYKVHTVLTDNGIQFCDLPSRRNGPTARLRMHMFDRVCLENNIEHRLTKPNHPWTNGQVERMNRTIKEATVKRYHYDRRDLLEKQAGKIQTKSDPSIFGTKHLATCIIRPEIRCLQSNPKGF